MIYAARMTEPQWESKPLPPQFQPEQPAAQPMPPAVAPGFYPDPSGAPMMRWHDGAQWTAQTAPMQSGPPMPQPVFQAPYTMTTIAPKRTSHGLHLFLTIITFGAWGLLVWLPITIIHKFTHEKSVTRVGY